MILRINAIVILTCCATTASSLSLEDYPLRLAGDGADGNHGRVEMEVGGVWGRVCSTGLYTDEVRVICRQLGVEQTGYARKLDSEIFGETFGMGSWKVSAVCNGKESHLRQCLTYAVSEGTCSDHSNLSIRCDFVSTGNFSAAGLIVGLIFGFGLLLLGPIIYIVISQRCKRKKYPAPVEGRAPLGKPVDRLAGNLILSVQISAARQLSSLDHELPAIPRQPPPVYTAPHYNNEMRPQQTAYPVSVMDLNSRHMTIDTSADIHERPPSIISNPPDYDDLFPATPEYTGMYATYV